MTGSDRRRSEPKLFADKLRLIMRVTGCETQKALFSKLKTVNPDTGYDPLRAYKWVQGRSSPRNQGVYEDLALLLDLGIGGERLRSSSYEAFHAMLAERYGDKVPPMPEGMPEVGGGSLGGTLPEYLPGRYLSISRAWSPHRREALVTGIATLTGTPSGGVDIQYDEYLPWGLLRLSGSVRRIGRNLIALTLSSDSEIAITFTFALSPAPGAILAGVMSGVTMNDAEMRPIAGRILCLRLPDDVTLAEEISGYIGLSSQELSRSLQVAGFGAGHAQALTPEILGFLLDGGDRGLIEAPIAAINSMIGKVLAD